MSTFLLLISCRATSYQWNGVITYTKFIAYRHASMHLPSNRQSNVARTSDIVYTIILLCWCINVTHGLNFCLIMSWQGVLRRSSLTGWQGRHCSLTQLTMDRNIKFIYYRLFTTSSQRTSMQDEPTSNMTFNCNVTLSYCHLNSSVSVLARSTSPSFSNRLTM